MNRPVTSLRLLHDAVCASTQLFVPRPWSVLATVMIEGLLLIVIASAWRLWLPVVLLTAATIVVWRICRSARRDALAPISASHCCDAEGRLVETSISSSRAQAMARTILTEHTKQ